MRYIILLLVLIFAVVAYEVIRTALLISASKDLVEATKAFSYSSSNPSHTILVIGDSTAVGVGTVDAKDSIAGKFHRDFPRASIRNEAISGQKLQDTLMTLRSVGEDSFDFVLIQSGANDIIYLTPQSEMLESARILLQKAKEKSDTVVFLTSGNIGLAPFFLQPVKYFYSKRSKNILVKLKGIAEQEGALFVDLYTMRDNDPFLEDIPRFYTKDLLHLTGDGYEVWYKKIRTVLDDAKELQ